MMRIINFEHIMNITEFHKPGAMTSFNYRNYSQSKPVAITIGNARKLTSHSPLEHENTQYRQPEAMASVHYRSSYHHRQCPQVNRPFPFGGQNFILVEVETLNISYIDYLANNYN